MIWLVGCRGMLGREIGERLKDAELQFCATGSETDITDLSAVMDFIKDRKFSYIINCSAYTAVDKAESEEEKAFSVNCAGVRNLAEAAKKLDAVLIHFSTDYVFSGDSPVPLDEADSTGPVSAYGRSKLAGENAVKDLWQKYYIFRISWLYGNFGANFVSTMIRLMNEREKLGIVNDQTGSPTYAECLANNIINLIKSDTGEYGVYHYSDEGIISWYDFALKIYEFGKEHGVVRKDTLINPISTDMYPTAAKRPAMSAFEKRKIKKLDCFVLKKWEDNLKDYFRRMVRSEKV